jgi:hypothetical protein
MQTNPITDNAEMNEYVTAGTMQQLRHVLRILSFAKKSFMMRICSEVAGLG